MKTRYAKHQKFSKPLVVANLPVAKMTLPRPVMEFESHDFNVMYDILTYKRRHDSDTEIEFCDKYFADFDSFRDSEGEVMAYVYKADDQPILWSCHTDTVHNGSGYNFFTFDEDFGYFAAKDEPLGADDGAGVWLLLSMIENGVGGTYIFHRGEEVGGIGSSYMAKTFSSWLKQFTHAIAFDRRKDHSVITHQGGTRCCSDAFAQDFASLLPRMKLDTGGSFTDTKNYTHLISECTNISIGYDNEHSQMEILDFTHTIELRDAIVERFKDRIDLIKERDETKIESRYKTYDYADYWSKPYKTYNAGHDSYVQDGYLSIDYDQVELLEVLTDHLSLDKWAEHKSKREIVEAIRSISNYI